MNNSNSDIIVIDLENSNIIDDTKEITVIEEQIKENYKVVFNKDQIINHLTELVSFKSIDYYNLFFEKSKVFNLNFINPVISDKLIKSYTIEENVTESEEYQYESLESFLNNINELLSNNVEPYKNIINTYYNFYKPFFNNNKSIVKIEKNIDAFLSYGLETYRKIRIINPINIDTGKRSELIDSKEGCQNGLKYIDKTNIINLYEGDKINITGYMYYINQNGTEIFSLNKYKKYLNKLKSGDNVDIYFSDFVFDEKLELVTQIKGKILEGNLIQLPYFVYIKSIKKNVLKLKNNYNGYFIYSEEYGKKFRFYKALLKQDTNIYFHIKEYKKSDQKYINPIDISELLHIYYINNYDLSTFKNINDILKKHNCNIVNIDKYFDLTLKFLLNDDKLDPDTIKKIIPNFKFNIYKTDNELLKSVNIYDKKYIDSELNRIIYLNSQIGQNNYLLLKILDSHKNKGTPTHEYVKIENLIIDKNMNFPNYKDIIDKGVVLIKENVKKDIDILIKYYQDYNKLININSLEKLRKYFKFISKFSINIDYNKYLGNNEKIDFDKMYGNIEYNDIDNYKINKISDQLLYDIDFMIHEIEDDTENIENDDILLFFINDMKININKEYLNYIYDNIRNKIPVTYVSSRVKRNIEAYFKKNIKEKRYKQDINYKSDSDLLLKKKSEQYKIEIEKVYNQLYTEECISYLIIFIMNKYPYLTINKLNSKCVKYFSYKPTTDKSLIKYFTCLIIQYRQNNDIRFNKYMGMNFKDIEDLLTISINKILEKHPELKSNVNNAELIENNFEKYKILNLLYRPNKQYDEKIKNKINIEKTYSLIPNIDKYKPQEKEYNIIIDKKIKDYLKNDKKQYNIKSLKNIFEHNIFNYKIKDENEIDTLYDKYITNMYSYIDNLYEIPTYIKDLFFDIRDIEKINNYNISLYLFLKTKILNIISKIINKKELYAEIHENEIYINTILPDKIMHLYDVIIKNNINLSICDKYESVFSIHIFLFLSFLIGIYNLSLSGDVSITIPDENELHTRNEQKQQNIISTKKLISLIIQELEKFIKINDTDRKTIKQSLEIIREEDKLRKMMRT